MKCVYRALKGAMALLCLILTAQYSASAAAALPPKLEIIHECVSGMTKSHAWRILEDRDGDGEYDWVVMGHCGGYVTGGPYPEGSGQIVGSSPFQDTYLDFSYALGANNHYQWVLVERRELDGVEVCRFERDMYDQFATTCPASGFLN